MVGQHGCHKKLREVDFELGYFVWAFLTKDYFSVGEYKTLSSKKIRHMDIADKINSNAYHLNFASHIRWLMSLM